MKIANVINNPTACSSLPEQSKEVHREKLRLVLLTAKGPHKQDILLLIVFKNIGSIILQYKFSEIKNVFVKQTHGTQHVEKYKNTKLFNNTILKTQKYEII